MSFAASAALQTAIFARLSATPALSGVALHDAQPPAVAGTFILLGPEEVRDASDQSGAGAVHRVTLSVISDAEGFLAAKTLAVTVSDVLSDAPLVLSRGRVVSVRFERGRARRLAAGSIRRIDLTFRIRVEI